MRQCVWVKPAVTSTLATGGVCCPMPRFSVTMMPKCTGSMPTRLTSGMTIGTIIAFTTLQSGIFRPIMGLLNVGASWVASMALFSRVFGYLDLEPEVGEGEDDLVERGFGLQVLLEPGEGELHGFPLR